MCLRSVCVQELQVLDVTIPIIMVSGDLLRYRA